MQTYKFVTPWGSTVQATARGDRSDYNTLNSCIATDEYHLKELGAPGEMFIDIGAHIGGATVAAVSRGMKTLSVEVLDENVNMIAANLLLSGLSADNRIEHAAIHHTSNETIYAIYGDNKTHSGFHHEFIGLTATSPPPSVDSTRIRTVTTISLADLFKKYAIEHARILKVDCEGAEWQCFRDVPEALLDRIDYIIGEIHPDTTAPTERSPLEFLTLLKNRFVDVSTQYGELGFAAAVAQRNFSFNFVLKHI